MKEQQTPKLISIDPAKKDNDKTPAMEFPAGGLNESPAAEALLQRNRNLENQLRVALELLQAKINNLQIKAGDLVQVKIAPSEITPGYFHTLRQALIDAIPAGCEVMLMSGSAEELCVLTDEHLATLGLARIPKDNSSVTH